MLQNPAGEYSPPEEYSPEIFLEQTRQIAAFPTVLKAELEGLSPEQILTHTLPGNWTVAQVVHHLADSHMNALIRLKLALTEDNPQIKPYAESLWAELADGTSADLDPSFRILEGVHHRFAEVLESVNASSAEKTYLHPELHRKVPVYEIAALYSWHGKHHMAHIRLLRESRGW